MDARRICEGIEKIDPSVGLAILDSNFTVTWANSVHRSRWPGVVGKVCYKHLNHFERPCQWCPAVKTFETSRIHAESVYCPSSLERYLSGDIRRSNIVTIPLADDDGAVKEMVEAVFDRTWSEKAETAARMGRYQAISRFGRILETLKSEDQIRDYLPFGIVRPESLDFPSAELYILEESEDVQGEWVLVECRSLAQADCTEAMRRFHDSLTQNQLTNLRGLLSRSVRVYKPTHAERVSFEKVLADRCGVALCLVHERLRSATPAMRLSHAIICSNVIPMTGGRGYLLTASKSFTGHDLATDRELFDLAIYTSVIERSLRNRDLSENVDVVLRRGEAFLNRVEGDIHTLYFAASVVSSVAHDLLTSCDTLTDQLDFMYSRATPTSRERMEPHRLAAKKDIEFLKGCLKRAVDVARMRVITQDDFLKYDVHLLISEVETAFQKVFDRAKIKFSFGPRAKDGTILCEGLLIRQVLNNLVDNACTALEKASHRVRGLRVATERQGYIFRITVEDNGVGIDPVYLGDIWRPFFSTKAQGLGTGLGLLICKKIVSDVHAGTIEVSSKHGYWTKFVVSLPCAGEEV